MKSGLVVQLHDLARPETGFFLDLLVQFQEGHVQSGGQKATERGLPCAAQANKRDTIAVASRADGRRSDRFDRVL